MHGPELQLEIPHTAGYNSMGDVRDYDLLHEEELRANAKCIAYHNALKASHAHGDDELSISTARWAWAKFGGKLKIADTIDRALDRWASLSHALLKGKLMGGKNLRSNYL
jgi:hypothetical protein